MGFKILFDASVEIIRKKKNIYSRRCNDVKEDQIWDVYKSLTLDTLEEHMNVKKANI